MNDISDTSRFAHLWNLYDDSAIIMSHDLNNVRMPRLYSGAITSVQGDVYLNSAILKAEEILSYLKAAQARRERWIDMHENGAFWLEDEPTK